MLKYRRLKQCLFERTKQFHERYITFKSKLGENHEVTLKSQYEYLGCYFVLQDSGLWEEYETWLKNQEKGSEKCA